MHLGQQFKRSISGLNLPQLSHTSRKLKTLELQCSRTDANSGEPDHQDKTLQDNGFRAKLGQFISIAQTEAASLHSNTKRIIDTVLTDMKQCDKNCISYRSELHLNITFKFHLGRN